MIYEILVPKKYREIIKWVLIIIIVLLVLGWMQSKGKANKALNR